MIRIKSIQIQSKQMSHSTVVFDRIGGADVRSVTSVRKRRQGKTDGRDKKKKEEEKNWSNQIIDRRTTNESLFHGHQCFSMCYDDEVIRSYRILITVRLIKSLNVRIINDQFRSFSFGIKLRWSFFVCWSLISMRFVKWHLPIILLMRECGRIVADGQTDRRWG